ncbi:hypothetical protein HanPSC8_Chr10g0449611 [Helianthus annuus]|nr:hypothetical protein HanPSC8_Chr10g0449601 [Helianthus annuus]KAJ0885836.1 hypothetical protein HanPSC8_Chr10g0449611 [Helianthus annuus]
MYDGSGEETGGCFCVCSIPAPTSSSGRHAININFRFESGPSVWIRVRVWFTTVQT